MKSRHKEWLLHHPPSRDNFQKSDELRLWCSNEPFLWRSLRIGRNLFGVISFCFAVFILVYSFWPGSIEKYIPTMGVILIITILISLIFGVSWRISIKITGKVFCKNRTRVTLEDFIKSSKTLEHVNHNFIQTIRLVLGHIYGVDPEIIRPDDSADSLRKLGTVNDPFGFEVVMGTCERFETSIQEDEVYSIVKRIYNDASSVEQVIKILSDELPISMGK